MKNTMFICVDEVVEELGVSKPFAYKLIRQMNNELKAMGYITIQGRVNRKYFMEKFYGAEDQGGDKANACV